MIRKEWARAWELSSRILEVFGICRLTVVCFKPVIAALALAFSWNCKNPPIGSVVWNHSPMIASDCRRLRVPTAAVSMRSGRSCGMMLGPGRVSWVGVVDLGSRAPGIPKRNHGFGQQFGMGSGWAELSWGCGTPFLQPASDHRTTTVNETTYYSHSDRERY